MGTDKPRRSVFELLALREKISITKKSRNLSLLRQELEKTERLRDQLDAAIDQTENGIGEQTAGQLRANNWYRGQMMEQRDTMRNRESFLSQEVDTTRRDVAQSRRRETRAAELATTRKKTEAQDREDKAESDLFDRRRG
jgi:hypothetical protein